MSGELALPRDASGQSTVEYAVLLVAFVAMAAALAALWHAASDGVLLGLATQSASHGTGQGWAALLKDVVGY